MFSLFYLYTSICHVHLFLLQPDRLAYAQVLIHVQLAQVPVLILTQMISLLLFSNSLIFKLSLQKISCLVFCTTFYFALLLSGLFSAVLNFDAMQLNFPSTLLFGALLVVLSRISVLLQPKCHIIY